MGSVGLFAGFVLLALLAAGVFFYWSQQKGNGEAAATARLFTPRGRRLAFVERTSLDGGRKLLLIRRDNVEHLVLIGGPVDLVVESGIRLEESNSVVKDALSAQSPLASSAWSNADATAALEPAMAREPLRAYAPGSREEDLSFAFAPRARVAK